MALRTELRGTRGEDDVGVALLCDGINDELGSVVRRDDAVDHLHRGPSAADSGSVVLFRRGRWRVNAAAVHVRRLVVRAAPTLSVLTETFRAEPSAATGDGEVARWFDRVARRAWTGMVGVTLW